MDKYAELNDLFRTRLDEGPSGIKLAAEAAASYIKVKLREESFARKVIPAETLTKADVQRSESGDGVYKLVDIEPDSSALVMSFRPEAPARYVYGDRYRINFFKVASERFEKNESELLAYESPITKILEENSVLDIQKQEDQVFYNACVTAVTGSSARDTVSSEPTITKTSLAASLGMLASVQLKPYSMLMCEELFYNVLGWGSEWVGIDYASKILVGGYDQPTLLDRVLIVTNKRDIVSTNEVWHFAKPEFLGRFYVLEDTKFWIDKKADMIEWESWEIIGMGFGNANAVARLTYTG